MAHYLLDTNHISPLVTIGHPLREKILTQRTSINTFAIATPALSEFLFGVGMLLRAVQSFQEWQQMRLDFIYYHIDAVDAEQAAQLRILLRRQGWQLGLVDALVAVVALRNDLILLTTDKDFAGVPGLKIENWRDLSQ